VYTYFNVIIPSVCDFENNKEKKGTIIKLSLPRTLLPSQKRYFHIYSTLISAYEIEMKNASSESSKREETAVGDIPRYTWRRQLSQAEPSRSVHTFSRPPVLEALSLLNVAARVGMYISSERARNREPIFDLRGISLEPPNPGQDKHHLLVPFPTCPS